MSETCDADVIVCVVCQLPDPLHTSSRDTQIAEIVQRRPCGISCNGRMYVRSLGSFDCILWNGTSSILFQLQSITAAPIDRTTGASSRDTHRVAAGDRQTPRKRCPSRSSVTTRSRTSFLPEQAFGLQ